MDLIRQANSIYAATKCNPSAVAQVRAEFSALALSQATDADAGFELTSSTVNGQTFSGQRKTGSAERLEILRMVVWSYDNGRPYPRTTRATF